MERVEQRIPAGATVLADAESMFMLEQRYFRREERRMRFPEGVPIPVRGWTMIPRKFSWAEETPEEIRAALNRVGRPVWILDMGFNARSLWEMREMLEMESVIDEPGILFLGRVR